MEKETEGRDRSVWNTYPNWLTLLGAGLVALAFFSGVFLFLLEITSSKASPYVGVNYIPISALLVIGFICIPLGIWRERRRQRSQEGRHPALSVDFTSPRHVYAALSLLAGALVVVLLLGIASYRSYHASETAEFCGELCHQVMEPEWVSYHRSAHARVACAECHIGSGAGWYVRSKLSGLRQVWAVAMDTYPRPIPTPIHDLRPARETCEECHWRRKFIGYKESVRSYFLSGEESEPYRLRMLVKIGGEGTSLLKGSGIHYHMLIANKVEYIAVDERRQEIGWVRVTRADGSVTEYENSDSPLPDDRSGLAVRTMDCMDCHNRPAHQFPSPVSSVNAALDDGRLSRELPYIKVQAVEALSDTYESDEKAMVGIANTMRSFYREEYPEFVNGNSAVLINSIQQVQDIYKNTMFPLMHARWSAYPDNIGHLESPGCFRCHTEAMESKDGQTIFTSCSGCHVILAQGDSIEKVEVNLEEGLPFVHPEDFSEMDEFENCSDCHTGGSDIYE
jgi:nitrate/TMAO reductase-like tetraheme cytochrome c subunit